MRRLALILVTTFCLAHATAADTIESLRDAIALRLSLMEDVARFKWNHQLPIEDPTREAALLERATGSAVALGLSEDYARRVLSAQLRASRTLQTILLERWRADGRGLFTNVPDLAGAQRPAIDSATIALIEALALAHDDLERRNARATLGCVPPTLSAHSLPWSIATAALWPTAIPKHVESTAGNSE